MRKIALFYSKHPKIANLLIAFVVSALMLLLCSGSTSPLYGQLNASVNANDSLFNMYLGDCLLHGQKPYIDFYDHKGMFHIYLNALGLLIGGGNRIGILLLEIIFTSVGLYAVLETMRALSLPLFPSLFGLSFFVVLHILFPVGNSQGEWIMPFTGLALLFYTKGIVSNENKYFWLGSIFIGIEMGLSLNCRISDALWGPALTIAYFIYYLRKQKNLQLLLNAGLALLFLSLTCLIFLLIAIGNGYAQEMVLAALNNFKYAGSKPDSIRYLAALLVVICLIIGICVFLYERKDKERYITTEFFFVIAMVAGSLYLVIAHYTQYYWSGYAFYAVWGGYFSSFFYKEKFFVASQKRTKLLTIALHSIVVLSSIVPVTGYYLNIFDDFKYWAYVEAAKELEIIPREAFENQDVYFLDSNAAGYEIYGYLECNCKYASFQTWWSINVNPEVRTTVIEFLSSEDRPTYVVTFAHPKDYENENFRDVLDEYYVVLKRYDVGIYTIWNAK